MLPPGWMSFKKSDDDPTKNLDYVRKIVGNYSYIAIILIVIMQFSARIGVAGMSHLFLGEVFPFK